MAETESVLVNRVIVGTIPVMLGGFMWLLSLVNMIDDGVDNIEMDIVRLQASQRLQDATLHRLDNKMHIITAEMQRVMNHTETPKRIPRYYTNRFDSESGIRRTGGHVR